VKLKLKPELSSSGGVASVAPASLPLHVPHGASIACRTDDGRMLIVVTRSGLRYRHLHRRGQTIKGTDWQQVRQ
jgi:hypothetical protein